LAAGGGAVLLTVTKLLPHGRAVGIDLWKTANQSGNALEVTKRNAELEGVADRVDLQTADVRSLPFEDESLDLVLSSLASHNITDAQGRAKAIDEAVRLLRRGSRLLIVDIGATAEHVARLRARWRVDVTRRSRGPRFWFGNPWVAGTSVTGRKPG
jgi:ubiquinone/menaquinone biosynthesis C-methylase UbiE